VRGLFSRPVRTKEEKNGPPSVNQGHSTAEPRHRHAFFSLSLGTRLVDNMASFSICTSSDCIINVWDVSVFQTVSQTWPLCSIISCSHLIAYHYAQNNHYASRICQGLPYTGSQSPVTALSTVLIGVTTTCIHLRKCCGSHTEVCRLVVQEKWLIGSTSQGGEWISTPVGIIDWITSLTDRTSLPLPLDN